MGQHLAVNPDIVRVVALLLPLMGEGVLLHLVAWLLLPDAQQPSAWSRWWALRQARRNP